MKIAFILLLILPIIKSTVFTLSGGELTINGAITDNYVDFFINFTANVQWVAIIWSQNEADTDVTLFKANPSDPANPVSIVDCYLDQNSAIQQDNIPNFQTSVTGFTGSTANGISAAFKRDLVTGDTKDAIIYPNSVSQICAICSLQAFVGGGHETGNQKGCSYLSFHKNVDYLQDRLLGNFAGTKIFGGGNITIYATESSDGFTLQSWLFLTVVHKVEGLNPFIPRWIGVLYQDSFINSDLAIIQYNTVGVSLDVHIDDFFTLSSSSANYDYSYTVGQGSNDIQTVMTAYDSSSYIVGSFKRKFETGDTNRDAILANGLSTYCVIYGPSLSFISFGQADKYCFSFTLSTQYSSNFRQTSSTSVPLQTYVAPQSTVTVVTAFQNYLVAAVLVGLMILV